MTPWGHSEGLQPRAGKPCPARDIRRRAGNEVSGKELAGTVKGEEPQMGRDKGMKRGRGRKSRAESSCDAALASSLHLVPLPPTLSQLRAGRRASSLKRSGVARAIGGSCAMFSQRAPPAAQLSGWPPRGDSLAAVGQVEGDESGRSACGSAA